MDCSTADTLNRMNSCFYADHAASFSATRSGSWAGWERLIAVLQEQEAAWSIPTTVLDVACGNFRFERFLREALPDVTFHFHCMDNCQALVDEGARVYEGAYMPVRTDASANEKLVESTLRFYECDVVSDVLHGVSAFDEIPRVDVSVSFGFLHHIPSQAARIRFVRELLEHTRTGGSTAVSLWRFADEPARFEKALRSTEMGCREWGIERSVLDIGDYLLGWQNTAHAYRYCHSFNDTEIGEICAAVADLAVLSATFRADGKSGALNEYLVFRVL